MSRLIPDLEPMRDNPLGSWLVLALVLLGLGAAAILGS